MESDYRIYLICYHNGRPIDFLLPIYTLEQFAEVKETAGTCFKIRDPHNVEIMLACRNDNKLHTIRINIESSCKANTNISFVIVTDEKRQSAFLRAFTDSNHNGCYPIPLEFMEQAYIGSQ